MAQRDQLAVLTNKPVRVSRDILAGLGLHNRFFQVYGGNSFETKKPESFGSQYADARTGAARTRP